jgi:hypothetical protein
MPATLLVTAAAMAGALAIEFAKGSKMWVHRLKMFIQPLNRNTRQHDGENGDNGVKISCH